MPPAAKQPAAKARSTARGHGIAVGDKAPAFTLPATQVGMIGSAGLKGQPYILYFYPKDATTGCTQQAGDFRDGLGAFRKLGVAVIGISRDSLASHEKFARAQALSFPLASDEGGTLTEAYGVWVEKSMYGRKYMGIERSTFLIDGQGVVRAVWRKVGVPGHVVAVQKAVKAL